MKARMSPNARDGLLVGLLLMTIVMLSWQILMQGPGASRGVTEERVVPGRGGRPGPPPPPPPMGAPPSPPGSGQAARGTLHFREYLAGMIALESSPDLRLTPRQARALSPLLRRFQRMNEAISTAGTTILQTVTPRQRAFLDRVLNQGTKAPDPRYSEERLLQRVSVRLLKAMRMR